MHTRSQKQKKSKGTKLLLNPQAISSNSEINIQKSTKSILDEEESESESVKIQVRSMPYLNITNMSSE